MDDFHGYRYDEITIITDISKTLAVLSQCKKVFLVIETIGRNGICFLIQFSTEINPKEVFMIKVLKTDPLDICNLVDMLSTKKIICHDSDSVIFHLSKLYTISKVVSTCTFDNVWEAEGVFRVDETSYENRLDKLYGFYPKQVIDLKIVAKHTLPFADELIKDGGNRKRFKLYNFPSSCIEKIKNMLTNQSVWEKLLQGNCNCDYVDYINFHKRFNIVKKNTDTKFKKQDLKKNPNTLVNIEISYDSTGIFGLKGLGQHFKYVELDDLSDFDFLKTFDANRELEKLEKICTLPTIPNRVLYESVFSYCRRCYSNLAFLKHSTQQVLLLQLCYSALPQESDYGPALLQDMSLAPYLVNLKLYGIKLDRTILTKSRENLSSIINDLIIKLQTSTPKLEHLSSTEKTKEWSVELLSKNLQIPKDEAKKIVPNMKKTTVAQLIESNPEILELQYLKKYKEYDGILKYVPSNTEIDTIFPKFNIYGTVTGRVTSKNPSGQQIPNHTLARNFYIAPKGYILTIGDFNALEVRIMGYLFSVDNLSKAFNEEKDPHTQMAAKMFTTKINERLNKKLGKDEAYFAVESACRSSNKSEVEEDISSYREIGKLLNFAIPYGTTAHGLSEQLLCAQVKAKGHINEYFKVNPELKDAIERSNNEVKRLDIKKTPDSFFSQSCLKIGVNKNPILPVISLFKLERHFVVAHSIMRIFNYIADEQSSQLKIPKTTRTLLSKSLRFGLQNLQNSINREAFNFRIQSIGSHFTKNLQKNICCHFINPGNVHRLSDLSLLPTLNIHDELHFYLKNNSIKSKMDQIKDTAISELAKMINGKLVINFDVVESWAEKR